MSKYQVDSLADQLELYLTQLKKEASENPAKAKEEARNSLIQSGVLDENGSKKEQIVSWGY